MRFWSIGVLLALPALWLSPSAHGVPEQSRVPASLRLFALTSYERGDPWTEGVLRGYREALRGVPARLNVESLSERQRELHTYEDAYVAYLRAKYKGSQFDGILVSDDAALRFLLKHRNRLFPRTPVVFCGVGMWDPTLLRGHTAYVKGVLEPPTFRETLRSAFKLFPEATTLVLIVGDSPSSRKKASWIGEWVAKQRPQTKFLELSGLPPDELARSVASLPEKAVIYELSYHSTETNPHGLTEEEIWEVVARNARVPIFCTSKQHLANGCFGGLLNNGETQGREAAALLARWLMKETPPEEIPQTVVGKARYGFDHEQLRRFNVSPLQLPVGSELVRAPGGLAPHVRIWTLVGITLAGLQSLVIAALILSHLRRRRAEEALSAQTSLLRNVIANIPHLVFWKDRSLVFRGCNDNLARAASLPSTDDIIGKTDVDLPWTPNQIAHFIETDRRILETGKPVLDLE